MILVTVSCSLVAAKVISYGMRSQTVFLCEIHRSEDSTLDIIMPRNVAISKSCRKRIRKHHRKHAKLMHRKKSSPEHALPHMYCVDDVSQRMRNVHFENHGSENLGESQDVIRNFEDSSQEVGK